eukprot:jgi/Undpi1/6539/HiC_scaffold_20.g09018.m1
MLAGARGWCPRRPLPPIPSSDYDMATEDEQGRQDMLVTVSSVLEEMSFEEKGGLLGVVARAFGFCVEYAAWPGSFIVPTRSTPQPDMSTLYFVRRLNCR